MSDDTGKKAKSKYEHNTVYRSALTGQFYFVPRSKILSETTRLVVNKKYDITDYLHPFLLKRFRKK